MLFVYINSTSKILINKEQQNNRKPSKHVILQYIEEPPNRAK